jgi:hypothetical protein
LRLEESALIVSSDIASSRGSPFASGMIVVIDLKYDCRLKLAPVYLGTLSAKSRNRVP